MSKTGSPCSRKNFPTRGGIFDLPQKRQEVGEIEERLAQPGIWADRAAAEQLARRVTKLKQELELDAQLERTAADLSHVLEEPEAESLRGDIESQLTKLERAFAQLEFQMLLADQYDSANAIVAIHAGAGGTDAQDWAGMLLRMYLRFCEERGWTTRIVDESRGQEAGIKSVTFEIGGQYAYGYLKTEAGVHRLVRISPFDAEAMRHTSFALVEALPELEEIAEVQIDPKDIRIDTFMSGGHGGQSVNTTYSAVRIVHLPTKITVQCQNERSQTQNKETAMKILKAKLHQRYLEEQRREKQALRGEFQSAEWGSQIRSYVLHPYKLVKDHRTKYESKDPHKVLDGDLLPFIEAMLRVTAEIKK
ncbi:MAG: peptide chain release factor 2 [Candidatus Kerfeldbacteria bacterium]|nr:peptide chain release factor 2 [Candidatus Kerfeldbacteria bacterium]